MIKKIYLFVVFLSLLTTFTLNSQNIWQVHSNGLYVNKKGDVAIAVYRETLLGYKIYYKTYFTYYEQTNILLKDFIDLKTFKILGKTTNNVFSNDLLCIDKNNVYHYYATSCGGNFYISENIDRDTSHVLNDTGFYYADKNAIYYSRNGKVEDADTKTFVASSTKPYGKDKNNYFIWNEKISTKELVVEVKEELDRLYFEKN